MKVNDKLKLLYMEKYSILSQMIDVENQNLYKLDRKKSRATNPLLLKINETYETADLKIMFFGQETNIWYKEKNGGAFFGEIEPIINLYESFYLKGNCFKYGGQFWNGINRFETLIRKRFPDKKIGLIWNNVLKIGQCKKGFPKEINYITNKYFNVIIDEIKIIKPDYIIFFSGPNYDNLLKYVIGDFARKEIKSFKERELCEILSSNLPKSYRTYHPNYLWRTKNIDAYLLKIISEITTHFEN